MKMAFLYLLKEKRFLPLFITQFCGAFNDNAFKLAMLTLISYRLSTSQAQSEFYQALAGALFILPFFIFSAVSGQLADKYDKAHIARLIKIFEVILMIIGGLGLYLNTIFLMMITLTGMGIHSAFFGPIKYAILPDHLLQNELMVATGLIEGSTFIAILLGTILGTLSVGSETSVPYLAIVITLLLSFVGLFASMFIPNAPSSLSDLKIDIHLWRATVSMLKHANTAPGLLISILTISWFWLVGGVLLTKLPDFAHYVLWANTAVFALFLALFSIGIALGSLLVNKILQGRITIVWVPAAMLAFTWFTFDIYWASAEGVHQGPLLTLTVFFTYINHWRIAIDLLLLGFSGGLYTVPLYTYIQITSPPQSRARTIAANNIYNSLFMVIGTGVVMLLLHLHISIRDVFLLFSILNAAVGLVLWRHLREKPY
jgi:MFS family permease